MGGISDEQLLVMFIKGLPRDLKIQVMAKEPTTLNDGLEAARLFEGMLDVEKDNSVSTTNPFRSTREEILSEQVATLTEKLNVMSSNRDNSVGEQLAALNKKIEELSSKYDHIDRITSQGPKGEANIRRPMKETHRNKGDLRGI